MIVKQIIQRREEISSCLADRCDREDKKKDGKNIDDVCQKNQFQKEP